MSIDVKKAFTVPFSDPQWPKKLVILLILLGVSSFISNHYSRQQQPNCLLSLIAFIMAIYGNGYVLQYAQNEIKNMNNVLPEWVNINKYFINGLTLVFIVFIYILPIILLVIPVAFAAAANKAAFLPIILTFGLLLFVYSLVIWFLSPYITQSYVENYNFKDAFNVGKMLNLIFNNFGDYLISGVVAIVMVIVLMIPYSIFEKSIIGAVISAVFGTYYSLVVINLFAQAYRESKYPDNKGLSTTAG